MYITISLLFERFASNKEYLSLKIILTIVFVICDRGNVLKNFNIKIAFAFEGSRRLNEISTLHVMKDNWKCPSCTGNKCLKTNIWIIKLTIEWVNTSIWKLQGDDVPSTTRSNHMLFGRKKISIVLINYNCKQKYWTP